MGQCCGYFLHSCPGGVGGSQVHYLVCGWWCTMVIVIINIVCVCDHETRSMTLPTTCHFLDTKYCDIRLLSLWWPTA